MAYEHNADKIGSRDVAIASLRMACTADRTEEKEEQQKLAKREIHAAAVDFGGDLVTSINKLIERSVVAAKREGIIGDHHNEEGAVAGAAHEAITQIATKAIGFNVGGKIGIARHGDHVCVAMLFGVGLLHLNEIAVGLGHRAV